MFIKQISVSNFKSFKHLEINLDSFNVVIGANASGKSNFLEIFRFLRDIASHRLENAISLQGGLQYLRNANIGTQAPLNIKVVYQPKFIGRRGMFKQNGIGHGIEMRSQSLIYEFALTFTQKGYLISKDQLTRKVLFFEIETEGEEIIKEKALTEGEISIFRVGDKFDYQVSDKNLFKGFWQPDPILFDKEFQEHLHRDLTLLTPHIFNSVSGTFGNGLEDISIYNFSPKLSKNMVPITGKIDLEEDGNNLAVVLKDILENEHKRRKFLNLNKYLLEFIEDVQVEDITGKYLFLTFKEQLSPDIYFPANLMSEGTINLLALLVAAHFQNKPLIMIEEPERNIHPFLMAKMVALLKEAALNKQIIITTHNPEVVKQVDLANLLLVAKDKQGFSTISRPSENNDVKIFLENEIGVGELFIQNLLGL